MTTTLVGKCLRYTCWDMGNAKDNSNDNENDNDNIQCTTTELYFLRMI